MTAYQMMKQLATGIDLETRDGWILEEWYSCKRNIEQLHERMEDYAKSMQRCAGSILDDMERALHTTGSWAAGAARDFQECEQRLQMRMEQLAFLENYMATFVAGARTLFEQEREERLAKQQAAAANTTK